MTPDDFDPGDMTAEDSASRVRAHTREGTRGVREHLRHARENTVLAESLGILMMDEMGEFWHDDAGSRHLEEVSAGVFRREVGRAPTPNELAAFEHGAGFD